MKEFGLYAAAVAANALLIYLSEIWYGTTWFSEWLLGLLAIGAFALFLQEWKRFSLRGGGFVFITALTLLTINSIFFVQAVPAAIITAGLGLLIIPLYKSKQDVALTAGGFVFINLLIQLEVQSEATMWMIFGTAGILALIGFRKRFLLLRGCFTVMFSMAALVLLFLNFFSQAYIISLLMIGCIALFIVGTYRFSRKAMS
ncbi:hypothetical protein [Planococcus sp. YIM B11945]|uniref:hypothetical protein n=1 Tax=Planococcus sp. YIM B11945 TaxID=3435410 RepID=UPI003D7EAF0A